MNPCPPFSYPLSSHLPDESDRGLVSLGLRLLERYILPAGELLELYAPGEELLEGEAEAEP